MSKFNNSFTDGKPSLSAFNRYQNHQIWTSPSKVMAISNWCLENQSFKVEKHRNNDQLLKVVNNSMGSRDFRQTDQNSQNFERFSKVPDRSKINLNNVWEASRIEPRASPPRRDSSIYEIVDSLIFGSK